MNLQLNTVKVATAYPRVHVGDPVRNCIEIKQMLSDNSHCRMADVVLFPELCMTGYTCGDLFNSSNLLAEALRQTEELSYDVGKQIVVVGLPFELNHTLYNCAAVLNDNRIIGIVPKTFLPNYKEFYESRWFYPAPDAIGMLASIDYYDRPFGTDLLFQCESMPNFRIGVEICEDVWAPIPPSSFQAIAGATLLLNLSASNETVGKSDYRRNLIEQQSGRCVAAYAYCSSGPTESTTDLVFGGHCIIAENGSIVAETDRFKNSDVLVTDIDIEKLVNERRRTPTFSDSKKFLNKEYRTIPFKLNCHKSLTRKIDPHPFVPSNPDTLHKRCEEIFNIQVCALAKRMETVIGNRNDVKKKFVIGVSGGLDSTLALLVAVKAAKRLGLDPSCIDAVTLPGFGTSDKTKSNAQKLMNLLGVSSDCIDITSLCMQAFADIGHNPFGIKLEGTSAEREVCLKFGLAKVPAGAKDLVFENVQARIRTFLLMSRGFVLGTGDLSEAALGWCTYNGDHMSMYNVNCSIPKTLVKFLVKYVADPENSGVELSTVLLDIVNTTISPELLPLGKDGEIVHSTEDVIGPYELHDFFLLHFVRNNFAPKKIALLAKHAFEEKYSMEEICKWLKVFLKMFFAAQFKRSCVPDGPKVGSVSLSPRGDWRMPSDASVNLWLKDLEGFENE